MRDIPPEFQRITEQHVDEILHRHLYQRSKLSRLAVWEGVSRQQAHCDQMV
jgi:hypothetical protein